MSAQLINLARGFAEPVHDAGAVFRVLLDALAMPGRPLPLDGAFGGLEDLDAGIPRSLAAALLALADFETPVWIDADPGRRLAALIRFHCGAPLMTAAGEAQFAVLRAAAAMPALDSFSWGSAEYPDRGATLLIELPSLDGGRPVTLTGPGIETSREFAPQGLPAGFWQERERMQGDFPCGVDCYFFDASRVAGLPRTTLASVRAQ